MAIPRLSLSIASAVQREELEQRKAKQFRARPYDPSRYRDVAIRAPSGERSTPSLSGKAASPGPRFMTGTRLEYRRDALEDRFAGAPRNVLERHEAAQQTRAAREVCPPSLPPALPLLVRAALAP